MQTVKIQSTENMATKIFVGDSELKRVISIEFNQSVDTVPCFTFETIGLPDIEIDNADIRFRFTPETATDSIKVLRHRLLTDKELYNALAASMESAIKELPPRIDRECAARRIADRIIGREE